MMKHKFVTLLLTILIVGGLLSPSPASAQGPLDLRFGIVETYVNVNEAAATGAGYTRIILRQPVDQDDVSAHLMAEAFSAATASPSPAQPSVSTAGVQLNTIAPPRPNLAERPRPERTELTLFHFRQVLTINRIVILIIVGSILFTLIYALQFRLW